MITMTMTREEAVRVLAMLAQDPAGIIKREPSAWPPQVIEEQRRLAALAAAEVHQPMEHTTPAPFDLSVTVIPAPPVAEEPATTDSLVDTNGTPWDERIHSGGKSKMANGQWTRRRGVTPALYDKVMAELNGAVIPPAPVTPPAPPSPVTPPAPPAPVTPVAPPAPVEDSPFVVLQKKVQAWIAAAVDGPQRSERAQALGKALKDYGVVSIPALASQPDLIPAIEMALAL